jgi:transposase
MMNCRELFAPALGISMPWEIVGIDFARESKRLNIKIDFVRGSLFPCPECGIPAPVYSTKVKTWRHLNFFQYEAYLVARVPRVKCPAHGCENRHVLVPWGDACSGFTSLFEGLVKALRRGDLDRW